MGTRKRVWGVAAIVGLFVCSGLVQAKAYRLTVAGEAMEFVAQPERGYVVKLPERSGGLYSLAGLAALDTENARRVGGRDRRGVWTVENDGPAGRNEERIRALRAGGHAAYAAPLFSSGGETVAVIPEIVVRVRPGMEIEEVRRLCRAAGCTIRKRMEFTEQEYLLEVLGPDAEAVFAAAEELGRAAEVEWACPNTAMRPKLPTPAPPFTPDRRALPADSAAAGTLRITSVAEEAERTGVFPNDEYFPMQWHLYNTGQSGGTPGADIRAPEAWEITTGDPNIVVAEFGGYVDTNHPDLIGNLARGYDFVEPGSNLVFDDRYPWCGHSTWCAGIIAAQGNNGIGVAGVTWNCKVMPVRIWADNASGHAFTTEAERATAIRWAATNGADIMDNQWGFTSAQSVTRSALADVTKPGGIGRHGRGCVAVFCNGIRRTWYPGCYPEALYVGSTDHNDIPSPEDYRYPELDIVAPDWGIEELKGGLWTTDVTGLRGGSTEPWHPDSNILDYTVQDGASSVISGVAALILSVEPDLTGDEVRHFLERSAKDLGDPGRDDYYGWGRVDARAALDMVLAKRADLNDDWQVDEQDLAILTAAIDANDLSADIAPARKRDGIVDANDLELLTRYLGTVIPEMGLLAHWKLDETEGMVAHDSEGKNDATIMGVPLWQPEGGMVGGALQLSGTMNLAIAKFVRNPADGPLSVFAWVKGGAPGQVIVSQQAGVNWLMADSGTGTLTTQLRSTGGLSKLLSSAAVITDGDWHRVGFTWDGEHRRLYVDGILVAEDTDGALAASSGGLNIGCAPTMLPTAFWKGLIDDVRIYNRAVKP